MTRLAASWPRSGSLRASRAGDAPAAPARAVLASTRHRWPTLMRWDGWVGCGRFAGGRPLLCHMLRGRLTTRWSEWFMGFPDAWTAR